MEIISSNLNDYILKCFWSNDSESIILVTSSGLINIYNVKSGDLLKSKRVSDKTISTVDYSRERNLIALANEEPKVIIIDLNSFDLIKEIKISNNLIDNILWSYNSNYLAISSSKILNIYDKNLDFFKTFNGHTSTVSGLVWKNDNNYIASSSYGEVRIIPMALEPHKILKFKTSLISLSWSPNSKYIGAGTQEASIVFWPLPFKEGNQLAMRGYPTKIKILSWSFDSKLLASDALDSIVIWDVSGKGPAGTKPIILKAYDKKITCFKFMNKGIYLGAGDINGNLFVWNPKYSEYFIYKNALTSEITDLVWSPNDKYILASSKDGSFKVFQIN